MKKLFTVLLLAVAVAVAGCTPDNQLDRKWPYTDNGEGGGSQEPTAPGEDEPPVVAATPVFVTNNTKNDVVITINAKGSALANYGGAIYAHTGVLTDKSVSPSDWKYVKADWTANIDECKLTRVEGDIHTLTITGGPHAFYGVPKSEKILKLAFVFRSADGTKEMKQNGNDIYYELSEEGLAVKITRPSDRSILATGKSYTITAAAAEAKSLTLYKNSEIVATSNGEDIAYTYAPAGAEDTVFKAEATNDQKTVTDIVYTTVLGETPSEPRPAGIKDGVTVAGSSATFALYAPGKESVLLLGDFNDYVPSNQYLMKRDGDYFWYSIDGLEANKEYGYQFFVDGKIKVGDPYCQKILDPWNDKYINEKATIYPNLREYPHDKTYDVVSVFSTTTTPYSWQVADFKRPAQNTLAIYELLVRDFTESRTINAVTDKLDYLEGLGINAIELMPIHEFDGNDSWGYNPCFYFAADKAYGTTEDYKRFIDECHKRGIAVILDIVLNHATGQHPWAKMWWNASTNKTASNNPFFNVNAPHNFSVFHDFNHQYHKTRSYFKEMLEFWLKEYNVDGFRFDLTKGLVQNPGNFDAGGYSAQRIEILTDYAKTIREVEPDAYIIFEHFCDQREENELYTKVGALCWCNNQLSAYHETVMGWTGSNKSNFSDFKSGRINNIETHDEERMGYRAVTYADSYIKGNWAVLSKRMQAIYAFHMLTPYPKMMWQFGELGYDVSINANEDGILGSGDEYKTSRKPIRWEYLNDANRKAIYDAIAKCLQFRESQASWYAQENLTVHTWKVDDSNMGGKTLVMDKVIIVANFTSSQKSTTVNVPATGTWKNLMTGASVSLGSTYTANLAANDYIVLVRE